MRFLRRPRDVAKRTQLSGIYVCVCVSGLCVTFYVGYPSVIYDFRYVVWKRVRVFGGGVYFELNQALSKSALCSFVNLKLM